MNVIQEELLAGVEDVFFEMGSDPNVVLRRFAKGTTPGSVVDGQQVRLPVGSPIEAVAILTARTGRGEDGVSDLFVRPEALAGAGDLTSPDCEWTVEEIGSGRQLDVKAARKGGPVWKPFGPVPLAPVMWKARVVEGGAADG